VLRQSSNCSLLESHVRVNLPCNLFVTRVSEVRDATAPADALIPQLYAHAVSRLGNRVRDAGHAQNRLKPWVHETGTTGAPAHARHRRGRPVCIVGKHKWQTRPQGAMRTNSPTEQWRSVWQTRPQGAMCTNSPTERWRSVWQTRPHGAMRTNYPFEKWRSA
jgi:hypothetical protein